MFPFELTRPYLLALLALALPLLGMLYLRSLSDFPQRQRLISLFVRSAIVLLLVLSLAGLTMLHKVDQHFFIFLVDESTSIGENGQSEANKFLDQALPLLTEHRTAFLPFASDTKSIQSQQSKANTSKETKVTPEQENTEPRDEDQQTSSNTEKPDVPPPPRKKSEYHDGTNIAGAIETAAGYLPPGYLPHIILLSDGNQTLGDAVATATQSRIPISTVPLPVSSEPEVQISEVEVPAEVREGEPFFVEVVVHSNHDDQGLIEIYRGDHKVISEKRELRSGENRFRFQQSLENTRLASYTVQVSQLKEDTLLDNNLESGLVYAAGKPRVLIIESDPNLIRELTYALEEEGIQSDIRPPQGMPDSLSDLQNYELLILSNVPATSLSQKQMEIARTYVQELGGGFIMLGGEQSFGLGGYYKSALEEILPVRSDFEKEKETPALGMVLVIDKSGSMSGEKIEMAKSAARSAVELLGRRDKLGVLAFDGDTYVISEMQSTSNKARISDEIARIDAGGGTSMFPAMEMTFEMLLATTAKLKHVILLTDGISAPGDFEGMTQQMAASKMTVSTVAVGSGADTDLLESLARIGKGRYYFTDDPAQVPQIFAKETVTASKSAIDEQPFLPQVVRATHALSDLDMDVAPFLLGCVMTRPKPTSEVVLATEKGDPLLAWWRYGLGMTAAFTSDAKSRWAAEWMTWEGFGKFWTQVVRQVMRKTDARGIAVQTIRNGKSTDLRIDAVDELGQFLNHSEVELTVIDPRLKRKTSLLKQVAPGRYQADFATLNTGAYHMEIAVKNDGKVTYRQSRGLTVGYSDELRLRPTNENLLQAIASASGGIYSPDPTKLLEQQGELATRPTPLWPYLISLALLLLVIDVALRRIDFTLHWPFRHATTVAT